MHDIPLMHVHCDAYTNIHSLVIDANHTVKMWSLLIDMLWYTITDIQYSIWYTVEVLVMAHADLHLSTC